MGVGLKAKAFIVFFSAFVPCLINSYTGIRQTKEVLKNVGRTFGASNFTVFWKVGIAGLEEPVGGRVIQDGEELKGSDSRIGMVFQSLNLMPWRTVMANVEFGLEISGMSKKERREIAQKYIDLVGLHGFENSYPHELSGGMKQRVGIARAYTNNPEILLMDEPFGQLDAQTRYAMEEEVLRIWEKEKRTVIFVTNNIEEAVYLADRIVLLSNCPAKVKKIYDLKDLPRPRETTSPEFLRIRTEISDNTDLAL